jgi:DNA-binding GntR family transcriptional regulator
MTSIAKTSAAEIAYRHIRRRILDGGLAAGAFLI